MRLFGKAAEHLVVLIRDDSAPEEPASKIVVGPLTSNEVETVAVIPASPENEIDADAIGFTVVRELEVVDRQAGPGGA